MNPLPVGPCAGSNLEKQPLPARCQARAAQTHTPVQVKLQDAACPPLSRLPGHPGLVPKARPRRGSPGHPGPVVRDGVSCAASKTGGEARLVLATPPRLQGLVALRTLDGQTLLSLVSPHKGARARSAASSSRALWARRKPPPPALNKEPFAGAHAATPRRRPPESAAVLPTSYLR